MSSSQAARLRFLETTATEVGQLLFAHRRTETLREGRALAGGWPGTVGEARALTLTVLVPALVQQRMAAHTSGELVQVMHAAYGEARRAWLTNRHQAQPGPRGDKKK